LVSGPSYRNARPRSARNPERGKEFGASLRAAPLRLLDLACCVREDAQRHRFAGSHQTRVFDTTRNSSLRPANKYKGSRSTKMPALAESYERVTPEYKTLPGWCQSTYGLKDNGKLPKLP